MQLKVETFAKHPHWSAVKSVLERLTKAGHTAYLAGGCVRDALLGVTAKDFDVATSALPDEVEKLFPATVAVGKAFGVILVMQDSIPVEVATFRVDGEYRDGRRPDRVEFRSAKEDAERRDFTVNALFYDVSAGKVVDYVGGADDLKAKTIRTVGSPRKRFEEDKLRVLRGVRFASVLNFKIDEPTWLAIREFAPQIKTVSQERITEELKKLAENGDVVTGLSLLRQSGLADIFFSNFQTLENTHWSKTLRGLIYLGQKPGLKRTLAWLLLAEMEFASDKETTSKHLFTWIKSQRFSRDLESSLQFVITRREELQRYDSDAMLVLADGDGPLLLEMLQTLNYSKAPHNGPAEGEELLSEFIERYLEIADDQGQLPANFLKGDDLIKAGIKKGPRFGEILRAAHRLQLEQKILSRAEALKWLQQQN